MPLDVEAHPVLVVVGSGGVGKTTLAAALGLECARAGQDTLVMTFDPSLRLKDALAVGDDARDKEVAVPAGTAARLDASLLDARRAFDRIVVRYAPDAAARERILGNRFYHHLAGHLAGILEYMAIERLFEVAESGRYDRLVLDTPPTRQALDFLEAPDRIVRFLDSGGKRLAVREWFDADGRLIAAKRLGPVGSALEKWLDGIIGLELLRDMAEFFQSFGPLYEGFRERAGRVRGLLRSADTLFLLVTGPGAERIPDTLFFARKLTDSGYRLGPIVVNRLHPAATGPAPAGADAEGLALMAWLGEHDHRGLDELRRLVGGTTPVVELPLLPHEPTGLDDLAELGEDLGRRLA